MTLNEALFNQGNDAEDVKEIMAEMLDRILAGENPEEVLYEFSLEPDYVLELIEMAY